MVAQKTPQIPLPKSWNKHVRSAMLHIISLAQYAAVYSRSWAVDSLNGRVRLKAENDRLLQEVGLLREEIRIENARMGSIAPQRRPVSQQLPPAWSPPGDRTTSGTPT
jgi:hypothetical protein